MKAVQNALGHKSATMALDVYEHLWPGDEDRIRSAVAAALEPTANTSAKESD